MDDYAHIARSSDDGSSWTPEQPIALNSTGGYVPPVRMPDGSLLLAVQTAELWIGIGRSSDGGENWSFEVVPSDAMAWPTARFLATPKRLFASETQWCPYPVWCELGKSFESRDGGHSWTRLPEWLDGLRLLAADDGGNVYAEASPLANPSPGIRVGTAGGSITEHAEAFAWWWPGISKVAATTLGPLRLATARVVLEPETLTPVASVYFELLAPREPLVHRDDSIGSLQPRPDLAVLLPPPPVATDAVSPWLDPGPTGSQPQSALTLYQVTAAGDSILKLVRAPRWDRPSALILSW